LAGKGRKFPRILGLFTVLFFGHFSFYFSFCFTQNEVRNDIKKGPKSGFSPKTDSMAVFREFPFLRLFFAFSLPQVPRTCGKRLAITPVTTV